MIYFVKNNQDILTNKNDACIDPKNLSMHTYYKTVLPTKT